MQGGVGKSGELVSWGVTSLRSARHARSSRVLWPTCLQPLVPPSPPPSAQQQLHAPALPSRLGTPSLWKLPAAPRRERAQVTAPPDHKRGC
jgi:hypothetical protein